ncbi:hypothetical protein NC653_003113 [Populus alba x Populus x berolinensis]|uniref:Uncharacterized protein n=1 Tax=Populus alba x Populus x berolinensis TaxID=444605 RepID=A0AAD6RQL4_9ROSI|nr:hypothetical protein NC653_003113 [Populus alba x Populus x berolinensis]
MAPPCQPPPMTKKNPLRFVVHFCLWFLGLFWLVIVSICFIYLGSWSVGSTAGRALKSVVQGILLTSEAEKLHSRRELPKPASHVFLPSMQLHN